MMASYIVGANERGAHILGDKIPSIFQIQDWIENAWDMGIIASGRVETGGIKGTRKYIGTPEVTPPGLYSFLVNMKILLILFPAH